LVARIEASESYELGDKPICNKALPKIIVLMQVSNLMRPVQYVSPSRRLLSHANFITNVWHINTDFNVNLLSSFCVEVIWYDDLM